MAAMTLAEAAAMGLEVARTKRALAKSSRGYGFMELADGLEQEAEAIELLAGYVEDELIDA